MPTYNLNIPQISERPVDNLKFAAYKKIVSSYAEAVEIIKNKKPVLGEPVVVPYYYTHDEIDASTGENIVSVELAFGIGATNTDNPFITTTGDNIILTINGEQVSLKDKLSQIISETSLDTILAIEDDISGVKSEIDFIKTDISSLKKALNKTADKSYVDKSIADLNIPQINSDIDTVKSDLSKKADKSYVDKKIGDIDVKSVKDDVDAIKIELDSKADKSYVDKKIGDIDVKSVKDDVDTIKIELDNKADKSYVDEKVNEINNLDVSGLKSDVENVKKDLDKKVEWTHYSDPNRNHITLKNHDNIIGVATDGTAHNLTMVSKWDVADFGAAGLHMNLNSKDGKVTINDKKEIATVDQIPNTDNYATKDELNAKADTSYVDQKIDEKLGNSDIPTIKSDVELIKSSLDQKADKSDIPSLDGYIKKSAEDTRVGVESYIFSAEDKTKLDGLGQGGDYVLPAATAAELGGIKVGTNLNINETGVLSVDTTNIATKDEVAAKADTAYVDQKFGNVDIAELKTDVDTLKTGIELKADKTELTNLATKDEVAAKADTTYVNQTIDEKMGDADIPTIKSDVEALKTGIELKADKTELTNLATKDEVALKADTEELNSVKTELTSLATKDELQLKADKSDLDSVKTEVAGKANISDIPSLDSYATKDEVDLKADKTELTNLATKDEVNAKADTTYVDQKISDEGISTIKSDVDTLKSEIVLKADKTELTNLATKDEVNLKADTTYVDQKLGDADIPALKTDVETLKTGIELKADKTELTNLATKDEVNLKANISDIPSLDGYIKKSAEDTRDGVESYIFSAEDKAKLDGLGGGDYVLPTAGIDTLGGVKIGSNLTINETGVLSVNTTNLATKDEVNLKADTTYVDQQISNADIPTLKTDVEALKTGIELKADKTELTNLATKDEVSLKADKTEIPSLTDYATKDDIALKADITYVDQKISDADIPTIKSDVDTLKSEIVLKADKTELTDLATKDEVAQKADNSEIETIKTELSAKANTTDIPSLDNYATKDEVNLKADKTELTNLATKDEVSLKADKTEIPSLDGYIKKSSEDTRDGVESYIFSAEDKAKLDGLGGGDYVLPAATADTLGGVKIGPNLTTNETGVISVDTNTIATKTDVETKVAEVTTWKSLKDLITT